MRTKTCTLALPSRARSTSIGIAMNPLSSLPALVDVISHPTRPHFCSQQWISYDSVFGPRACFHSSCVLLMCCFPFNFLPLSMHFLPRTFAVFIVCLVCSCVYILFRHSRISLFVVYECLACIYILARYLSVTYRTSPSFPLILLSSDLPYELTRENLQSSLHRREITPWAIICKEDDECAALCFVHRSQSLSPDISFLLSIREWDSFAAFCECGSAVGSLSITAVTCCRFHSCSNKMKIPSVYYNTISFYFNI